MAMYGSLPTSTSAESSGTDLEFISRAKERVRSGLGTRRPWKEMISSSTHHDDLQYSSSFGIPSNFIEAISRIRNNLAYFRMNYAIIVLVIVFLSLLWHPISLIVFMVMMTVWLFLYFLRDEPLVIARRTIDDRVVLIVLFIVTIVALLLTHATNNIVISVSIGAVVVLIHSMFRKTEDLFVDIEEDIDDQRRPFNTATATTTTTVV